jgi:hypothetical protein
MAQKQSFQLQPPEQGNIRLLIYRPTDSQDSLYLEISTPIIASLCRRPRKYLRYLGWCILGIKGHVAVDYPYSEDDIGYEGPLEDQGVYRYCYSTDGDPEGLSFFIGACIVTLQLFIQMIHLDTRLTLQ